MRQNNLLFIYIICFFFYYQFSYSFVIDQSGKYVFGDDLIEFGTDVLVIDADDVIIDLNQHRVAGGTNGVVIASGRRNIQILNGFVENLSISGLSIHDTCSAVLIQNIEFSNCESRAIELLGTDTGGISDVFFDNIFIDNCGIGLSSDAVIHMEGCSNVVIDSGKLMNSGAVSNDIVLFRLQDSLGCESKEFSMINNQGASLVGIDVINSSNCQFSNCSLINSYAIGSPGNFTGVRVTGTQQIANIFSECLILSNTCDNEFIGFDIQENSEGNIVNKSKVHDNLGENVAVAFRISGTGTPSSTVNILFDENSAVRNSAPSVNAVAAGFQIRRADNGVIQNSVASYQLAEQGEAYGILFESGLGGDKWLLSNNEVIGNTGSSDANSFGISFETGSDNILVDNLSCQNGDIMANQLSGISQQIKGVDISGIFTTLNALDTNICNKFEGTFSVLQDISDNISVNFEGMFTTLERVCEKIGDGFDGVFTVFSNIDINGIFTAIDGVEENLCDKFEGVFTVLESLDFSGDFDSVFTTLDNICNKIEDGFDGTFTILDSLTVNFLATSIPISEATTISQPGNYHLTTDLNVNLATAIEITTGGVCLDLNNRTIANSGGVGIQVDSQNDICIKNGLIQTVTGIVFLNTCTNISVENISFIDNDLGLNIEEGIGFTIDNCSFRGNQQCAQITNSRNGNIDHCRIAENILPTALSTLLEFVNCNNIVLRDCSLCNNTVLDSGAILAVDNCSDVNLNASYINANFALDTLITVSVTNSLGVTFDGCTANNNTISGVSGAVLAGFGVFSSENIVFKGCQASEQVSESASAARAVGFLLNATTHSTILESLANRNRGATTSIGILLENTSTNNVVKFSDVIDNGSVGIQELTSSNNNGIFTNYAEDNPTNYSLLDAGIPTVALSFSTGFPVLTTVTAFHNIGAA